MFKADVKAVIRLKVWVGDFVLTVCVARDIWHHFIEASWIDGDYFPLHIDLRKVRLDVRGCAMDGRSCLTAVDNLHP